MAILIYPENYEGNSFAEVFRLFYGASAEAERGVICSFEACSAAARRTELFGEKETGRETMSGAEKDGEAVWLLRAEPLSLTLFWQESEAEIAEKRRGEKKLSSVRLRALARARRLAEEGEDADSFLFLEAGCGLRLVRRCGNEELIPGEGEIAGGLSPLLPESLPIKRRLKRLLYFSFSYFEGERFPWGALTGVRPSFVAAELAASCGGRGEPARRALQSLYGLSEEKAALALEAAAAEAEIAARFSEDVAAFYVHVPFCETRCSYCSFPAQDGIACGESRHRAYLEALQKEMFGFCRRIPMKQAELLYVGGGTPSVFSEENLAFFLHLLRELPGFRRLKERSFEAGRADSLNERKLAMIREAGFERICLNPQTMKEETLVRIGRPASAASVKACFALCRALEFEEINMDLIFGLPGETGDDFLHSVEACINLGADSISLHSLALKRKSELSRNYEGRSGEIRGDFYLGKEDTAASFSRAQNILRAAGYRPYYLYRHKTARAGLENLAFAKKGKTSAYNVLMMGDCAEVVGFGAGAMSKRRRGGKIQRLPSFASVDAYLAGSEELALKKAAFFAATEKTCSVAERRAEQDENS